MDVDQPSPSAQDTQSIGSDGTPQGEKGKEEGCFLLTLSKGKRKLF